MKAMTLASEDRTKRAKGNLDDFDAELIRAELLALEGKRKKKEDAKLRAEDGAVGNAETTLRRSPTEVSLVEMNPDSSRLLHKVVRMKEQELAKLSDSSTDTLKKEVPVSKNLPNKISGKNSTKLNLNTRRANGSVLDFKQKKNELKSYSKISPKATEVESTAVSKPEVKLSDTIKVMDAFVRPVALEVKDVPSTKELEGVRAEDSTESAINGMHQARQFNNFLQNNQKTNLQNQLEKRQLFSGEILPGSVVYDHGVQSRAVRRYNPLKSSHKMIGGVDQHVLGEGPLRRLLRARSVKFLMPVLAIFVIGGYIFYLNTPKISLKMAESRAGIAVSAPSYVPDNFSLNRSIETETGKVTLNFVNGEDSYSVSQSVSDWDSSALLENRILKETKDYDAYTDRGLTIYVYDGKALWVNQGKVNEIVLGTAKLDVEEMIRIAGSM